MPTSELVIRGQRVVLPSSSTQTHQVTPAAIHISRGLIQAVKQYDDTAGAEKLVTASDKSIIMPGLVDSHVHINEPGRTEWEGFATATRAAAAGGVTTLVDMPLNSIPPTTTLTGLEDKRKAAAGQCHVDVAFWGGVIPGNTNELEQLFSAGVVGFKCFLVHSGVDEFPNVSEQNLREALPVLASLGAVLIVHAEVPGPIENASKSNEAATSYKTFLESRPRAAENEAVALMIDLAREFDAKVHIVHHSSADALRHLREAKAERLRITAETCPHYLFFAAEEIPDGATQFKCCPPIREAENREQLWQALADGTIEMVVSDHSPCPPAMKLKGKGDFMAAWGGISSLQLRLPVMWTAAQKRGHKITDIVEWLCVGPARLVGLEKRNGAIAAGFDADLVIWNPERSFTVADEMIHHRHKLTPYAGQNLHGLVEQTFLRGEMIYNDGRLLNEGLGKLLIRNLKV